MFDIQPFIDTFALVVVLVGAFVAFILTTARALDL